MLQSTETLQNHAFIERSLGGMRDLLARPELEAQLTLTGAYRYLVENSFVPNVNADGVVSIPEAYQGRDMMPVLSAPLGRPLRLSSEFSLLTPVRERYARQALDACTEDTTLSDLEMPRIVHALHRGLGQPDARLRFGPTPGEVAGVTSYGIFYDLPRGEATINFRTPPVMVLRPQPDNVRVSPSVMLHETHHVLQSWWRTLAPWQSVSERLALRQKHELEAYGVGAVAAEHMRRAGNYLSSDDERHLRIGHALREAGAGRIPTDPTAEVMRHLCRRGIFIK